MEKYYKTGWQIVKNSWKLALKRGSGPLAFPQTVENFCWKIGKGITVLGLQFDENRLLQRQNMLKLADLTVIWVPDCRFWMWFWKDAFADDESFCDWLVYLQATSADPSLALRWHKDLIGLFLSYWGGILADEGSSGIGLLFKTLERMWPPTNLSTSITVRAGRDRRSIRQNRSRRSKQ